MVKELFILGDIDISALIYVHQKLHDGLTQAKNQLERDGLIQRFEYTYELAWKTIKKILASKGIIANSPRDVFRAAAQLNIIDNPTLWFDFVDKRNMTTHVYKQELADDVLEIVPVFDQEITKLIKTIQKL
jgi:nucleotidyltransferase substrate binding protein (TIGR01987 family)